jgi:hypothetical protein
MKRPGLSARNTSVQAAMLAHKVAEEEPTQEAAAPPALERGKPVGLSVRLDPVTHERLMDLAHDLSKEKRQRVSIHALPDAPRGWADHERSAWRQRA